MLVENRERRTDWIEHNAGRSDVKVDQKEWSDLWRVKVPSKVRVFLWRLAKQSIPTGDVRHHRNMATHNNCSICGCADSWRHSLLDCNMARCVWALQSDALLEFVARAQQEDARGWLQEAMEVLQHDDLVRLTVVLWAIWHARRQVIHENIFQSPLSTHNFVERFLFDLVKAMPKSVNREGGGTRVPRWIPPPNGMMKVNVDAALLKNMNVAAMAAVTRDEKGKF